MPWHLGYLPPHFCFHFEGKKSTAPRLSVESHPHVRGIAFPPLNAATPPEYPVTHDQTKSQTEQVDGTDGKWIIYQLYISIHSMRPFSCWQLAKAKLNFIDLRSTYLHVHVKRA